MAVLIVLAVLLFVLKKFNRLNSLSVLLLLGAALSNLIDRLVYGGVVDYLNLPLIPSSNISDLIIVISAVWFTININDREP